MIKKQPKTRAGSITQVPSSARLHIHSTFDLELNQLYALILKMGEEALAQLALSIDVVTQQKKANVKKVNASDKRLGRLERDVDRLSTRILALRQPMAVDLRRIVSAMKIASDIERFGDYSKNLARRAGSLAGQPSLPHASMLAHLTKLVTEMWERTLEAYTDNSPDLALTVFALDDAVDDHYTGLFREMLTYMMEDPRQIGQCAHILFMAKNLERMGDLATNASEEIYYQETGKSVPDTKSKT